MTNDENAKGAWRGSLASLDDPLATPDQEAVELAALRWRDHPEVQRACAVAAAAWRKAIGPVSADHEARFASALEQVLYHGLLAGMNLDAHHPRVHSTPHWAHEVSGRAVPPTLGGIPNPDSVYRFMPVDGVSSFRIDGHFRAQRPIVNEFSLVDSRFKTLDNLSGDQLLVGDDGHFTITVDPLPAGTRRNHLQSTPDAVQVLVRDTLGDWSREQPGRLQIERVSGPPARASASDEQQLEWAIQQLEKHMRDFAWASKLAIDEPVNTIRNPEILRGEASTGGFLVTQAYSKGHFRLMDDEAMIVTAHPGGAAYLVLPLNDFWSVTGDWVRRTSSLNNFQADLGADGSLTCVISREDPGYYNWLDPSGLTEGILFARWAGFDPTRMADADPRISLRVVKRSDLAQELPSGMRRIDAAGRARQIEQRWRDSAWRQELRGRA